MDDIAERLSIILTELDGRNLSVAAAYVSMALDRIQAITTLNGVGEFQPEERSEV